jgi:hypothetical protein
MLSAFTGTAMRWLRSQVAQVQTMASGSTRPAATEPASGPTDGAAGAAPGSGQPDVSLFAPGGEQFRQPDQTTCGSSSLIMAKMINTPEYGADMLAPGDDGTVDLVVVTKRFDQAVLSMHRTTGGWKDSGGTWQLPWPTQLGTPPWAVARQMSVGGGSGRPGTKYRAHLANPVDLGASYSAVVSAVDAGECVPLFIGDDVIARHVVLVTGASDDGLSLYDPSSGAWVNVRRAAYVEGNIDVAGWSQPWFVVTPS